jgi:excisionase family DNA binding protein
VNECDRREHSPAARAPVRSDLVSDDRYLPLRSLAAYSGLSIRTLRAHLVHPTTPLPHYRVGGKILIRRSDFDRWMDQFRVARTPVNLNALVDDLTTLR